MGSFDFASPGDRAAGSVRHCGQTREKGDTTRKEHVGLLAENRGHLILVAALVSISNLVGVIPLGAIRFLYGITLRVERRQQGRSWVSVTDR